MDDLIDKLRRRARRENSRPETTAVWQAADELTALRERVGVLEQALDQIATVARSPVTMQSIARAALSAAIGEDIGGGRG